ncbi:MAG: hypothetical protein HZC38_16780 [Chloroflexi bacterium]|nr:hypothetical protein [Chloroflexota bacterium]
MEITHSSQLHKFLSNLGERCTFSATIYIFGGSAILLIGGSRHTGDIDFTIHTADDNTFRNIIQSLANENGIDAEESVPSEFMPLPSESESRHQLVGHYGQLSAYIFDPYSIAIMKVDRAFERDLDDVYFLIRNGYIQVDFLEKYLDDVAQRYDEPIKLRKNFEEMKKGL